MPVKGEPPNHQIKPIDTPLFFAECNDCVSRRLIHVILDKYIGL